MGLTQELSWLAEDSSQESEGWGDTPCQGRTRCVRALGFTQETEAQWPPRARQDRVHVVPASASIPEGKVAPPHPWPDKPGPQGGSPHVGWGRRNWISGDPQMGKGSEGLWGGLGNHQGTRTWRRLGCTPLSLGWPVPGPGAALGDADPASPGKACLPSPVGRPLQDKSPRGLSGFPARR